MAVAHASKTLHTEAIMLLWLITFLSLALSYGSKIMVDAWLVQRVTLLEGYIWLQLAHNPGIAFSVMLGTWVQLPLIVLALVFVFYLAISSEETRHNHIGFGLILGGAVANLVDRLPDGVVTDFIRVGSFPIFNVADSCITVGVVTLLSALLFKKSLRG